MPEALKDGLQNLVQLVGNVTDAFTAALFLIEGDALKLCAYQTLSANVIPGVEIPVGHGLIGWVAKNERPTHATNFDRDTKTLQFYSRDEEIKSFAAVPVSDGDRVIGVLSIDSKQQYVFTDKAVKILYDFASSVASEIVQGKRRIKLDSEAVAFESLADLVNKVTVRKKFSELINVLKLNLPALVPHDQLYLAVRSDDNESFYLVNSESGRVDSSQESLPLTHYRLGWVIQQGMPVYLPDIKDARIVPGEEHEWKSFIGVPMMSHDTVTGAIGLVSHRVKAFRAIDTKSLAILAAACSSAFTSFYLLNKNRKAILKDPLTGSVSHRFLMENFSRPTGEGAVLMVNIAGFTKINIELGMAGGESVLADTVARLEEVTGDGGVVCRFYGDRFIILLKNISRNDVLEKIYAVEEALSQKPYTYGGYDIHVSTSIGAALFPSDGKEIEDLMLKAQVATEQARRSKGARISLYGEPVAERSAHLRAIE